MSKINLEFHKKIAKQCFNEAWDYLDKKSRDANERQKRLHLAHVSHYHWGSVGSAINFAVGAGSPLARAEPCMIFGRK